MCNISTKILFETLLFPSVREKSAFPTICTDNVRIVKRN